MMEEITNPNSVPDVSSGVSLNIVKKEIYLLTLIVRGSRMHPD